MKSCQSWQLASEIKQFQSHELIDINKQKTVPECFSFSPLCSVLLVM